MVGGRRPKPWEVSDALWDRIPAPELIPKLEAFSERWKLDVLYVEAVGYQLAMIQMLRSGGLAVRELHPGSRDKTSRFLVAVACAEGGKVWLPRSSSWTQAAVRELTSFPKGHDDLSDCVAYAVFVLQENEPGTLLAATPRGREKQYLPPGMTTSAPPGFGKGELFRPTTWPM